VNLFLKLKNEKHKKNTTLVVVYGVQVSDDVVGPYGSWQSILSRFHIINRKKKIIVSNYKQKYLIFIVFKMRIAI
jgi:hypothetical protein